MDIQPVNKGHILIVPKKHDALISKMKKKEIGELMRIANKVNNAIRKSKVKCEGVNFLLADGEAAGQEIFHVHLHVFPRFKNDGFSLKFPKGYKNKSKRKELEKIANEIRACF